MSYFYAHADADAGEPAVTINDDHPERPFAVVAFGTTRDITTTDPAGCRRVGAALIVVADQLETAQVAARPAAPRHSMNSAARR